MGFTENTLYPVNSLMNYWQEIRKRGLKVSVAGVPKTIDNDIAVNFLRYVYFFNAKSLCDMPYKVNHS